MMNKIFLLYLIVIYLNSCSSSQISRLPSSTHSAACYTYIHEFLKTEIGILDNRTEKTKKIISSYLLEKTYDNNHLEIGGPSHIGNYRELISIYSPLTSQNGERGLSTWNQLTDLQKQEIIFQVADKNQKSSRTISMGFSNKGFVKSPNEVIQIAKENSIKAHKAAWNYKIGKIESWQQLKQQMMDFNLILTSNLQAIRKQSGQISIPGQIRNFTIGRESRNGETVDTLMERFDLMAQDIFEYLKLAEDGKIEPSLLAAYAYQRFDEVKPFFDGNGRTELVLLNYMLMRFDWPIPTLIGDISIDETTMKYKKSIFLEFRSELNSFRDYIEQGIKETIRGILKNRTLNHEEIIENALSLTDYKVLSYISEGVQGKVYLVERLADRNKFIIKVAKTEAALAQMRREEDLGRLVQELDMEYHKYFLPVLMSGKKGSWLVKEYIDGNNGEEILMKAPLNTLQKGELKKVYDIIIAIQKKFGILFDIKPKNLMWHPNKNIWIVVDMGPKYLPLEPLVDFKTYFQTYWKK